MAVKRLGLVVGIWTACGVLFVAVCLLVLYLYCRRRYRRDDASLRLAARHTQQHFQDGQMTALCSASRYGEEFRRRSTLELECVPAPSLDRTVMRPPFTVRLQLRRAEAYEGACDILLYVERLHHSSPSDRGGTMLLGNDSYYHEDFLLYTSPLEFVEDGTYIIDAYTVRPHEKIVGAVHRFTFLVGSDPGSGGAAARAPSSTQLVDINVTRQQNVAATPLSQPGDPERQGPPPTVSLPPSVWPSMGFGPPLPPVISPGSGEVTTSTSIVITPHDRSTVAEQIRYSVDGRYPSLLYSGPFQLSMPPPSVLPSRRLFVDVQAIAVRYPSPLVVVGSGDSAPVAALTDHNVSPVVHARLEVRPGGLSYFDAQIPAPAVQLSAVDALLYFDETALPPGTQTVYELVYVTEARQKAKFSRRRGTVYNGSPIHLPESVASVHAWTVSSPTAADAPASGGAEEIEEDDGGRIRSVPTIYDCRRASTEHGKPSRRRMEQYSVLPSQLLPPPVICVSCKEMDLVFDAQPANSCIAYTLNGCEPALCDVYPPACAAVSHTEQEIQSRRTVLPHQLQPPPKEPKAAGVAPAGSLAADSGANTFIYQAGKRLRVTLLETEQVYVTARIFAPIYESGAGGVQGSTGAQGAAAGSSGTLLGYRYGNVFRRGFHFT